MIHIRNLKQALISRLILKKKRITCNQNALSKLEIDTNKEVKSKKWKKNFFSLNHIDINFVINGGRRNYVVYKPNFHIAIFF